MFYKIGVLKNFAKFTGNTCDEVPFNEVTGLHSATLRKGKSPTQVFSDEFCEIFKTPYLQNTSGQLFPIYEKIFYQYNSKKPPKKKKYMETAG